MVRQSTAAMRMEMAETGRDMKREQAMCSFSQAPDGWSGQYGGSMLCEKHYERIVDHIAEHGCLPSEDA